PPPRAGGRGDRRRARGLRRVRPAAGRARRRGVPARLRGRAPVLRRPAGRRTGPAARPRDGRARGGRPEHRRVRPRRVAGGGRARRSRTAPRRGSPLPAHPAARRGRGGPPRNATAPQPLTPSDNTRGICTMSPSTTAPPLPVQTAPGKPPLLAVQAGGRAADWTAAHRDALRQAVLNHGALLVRGLGLRSHAEIGDVFRAFSAGRLLPERESFAPRAVHQPGVFGSTKWPANQQMCMHHEQSFATDFPGVMMFACLTAPAAAGATPVADATAVLNALPRDLVGRFEREGWMLVRNYNDEIGSSYAEAFGTTDPAAVEHYCRNNGIEFEWQPGGGLRTRQRRAAIARHPVTGHFSWFNQIAFLNEWTLEPDVREFLVDTYGGDGLPFNTRFGSGAPVGPE